MIKPKVPSEAFLVYQNNDIPLMAKSDFLREAAYFCKAIRLEQVEP
jgi:hypothetical protein